MSVVIRLNGTNITNDVIIADAEFTALVNGQAGQANLRVRDDNQTYNFTTGKTLTLDIDSVRVWGGYVTAARKVYALPVVNTRQPTAVKRIWAITGADYNVLFSKRFLFKASDPAGKVFFSYATSTYDDTIINDIFDNYLDLSGDGLTRTGVQRIAKAILDVPGNTPAGPASAGDSWGNLMRNIARATGGVFYISPDKVLFYVDVETASSNYTLTDTPTGTFDLGYQNFELLENGSDLINDMMVWGAGTGSPNYVFSRTTDATSISTHGRWQSALVTSGLFRQASADIVSSSYVYGTPQSHRGGKDDAVRVTCRVFKPYFTVGQKVQVNIGIFGYSDVLPIRSMTIKFVNRTQAYFDLILSHVIDLPNLIYEYRFFDPANIDITHPQFHIPPPPQASSQVGCVCDCGITDTFTRTVSGGWGTSDAGFVWTQGFPDSVVSVDGAAGVAVLDTVIAGSADSKLTIDRVIPSSSREVVSGTLDFWADNVASDAGNIAQVSFGGNAFFGVSMGTGSGRLHLQWRFTSVNQTKTDWLANTWYRMRYLYDKGNSLQAIKVWPRDAAEPGAWGLTRNPASDSGIGLNAIVLVTLARSAAASDPTTMKVDNLNIAGFDRCIGTADNFNRSVSLTTHSGGTDNIGNYLGTASSGFVWNVLLRNSVAVAVNGTQAPIAFGDVVSGGGTMSASLPIPIVTYDSTAVHSFQFVLDSLGDATRPREESMRLSFTIGGSLPQRATIWIYPSNTSFWLQGIGPTPTASAYSQITWTSDVISGTQIPLAFWIPGVIYTFSIYVTAGVTYAAVTDGVTTYSTGLSYSHPVISQLSVLLQRQLTGGLALASWTVYLDNLNIPEISACELYRNFDNFNRTGTGGWGTATPSGLAWSLDSGNAAHFLTNGAYGQIETGGVGAFGTSDDRIKVTAPANTFWSANGYEMNAEFTLSNHIPISLLELTIWENTDLSMYIDIVIGTGAGGVTPPGGGYWGYSISGDTDVFGPGISWSLGTYHVRAVARPGIDLQVKVWNVLNTEPSTFTVVSNTSDPYVAGNHDFKIRARNTDGGNTGHDVTYVSFDYIDVQYAGAPCAPGATLTTASAHVGWVTETFVATGGQLLILLANALQVYTAAVYINGTRQSPSSYIESPTAGTVLLDTALTAGDDVVVHYYATGARI